MAEIDLSTRQPRVFKNYSQLHLKITTNHALTTGKFEVQIIKTPQSGNHKHTILVHFSHYKGSQMYSLSIQNRTSKALIRISKVRSLYIQFDSLLIETDIN